MISCRLGPHSVVTIAVQRPAIAGEWAKFAPYGRGLCGAFLTTVTAAKVAQLYPPGTLARLAAIKDEYDPGNLFSQNLNVPPSGIEREINA